MPRNKLVHAIPDVATQNAGHSHANGLKAFQPATLTCFCSHLLILQHGWGQHNIVPVRKVADPSSDVDLSSLNHSWRRTRSASPLDLGLVSRVRSGTSTAAPLSTKSAPHRCTGLTNSCISPAIRMPKDRRELIWTDTPNVSPS